MAIPTVAVMIQNALKKANTNKENTARACDRSEELVRGGWTNGNSGWNRG